MGTPCSLTGGAQPTSLFLSVPSVLPQASVGRKGQCWPSTPTPQAGGPSLVPQHHHRGPAPSRSSGRVFTWGLPPAKDWNGEPNGPVASFLQCSAPTDRQFALWGIAYVTSEHSQVQVGILIPHPNAPLLGEPLPSVGFGSSRMRFY